MIYLHDKPTNAIYKYVQSQIAIIQQHVSTTPVTIIRVSYNKNTISVEIIVQNV